MKRRWLQQKHKYCISITCHVCLRVCVRSHINIFGWANKFSTSLDGRARTRTRAGTLRVSCPGSYFACFLRVIQQLFWIFAASAIQTHHTPYSSTWFLLLSAVSLSQCSRSLSLALSLWALLSPRLKSGNPNKFYNSMDERKLNESRLSKKVYCLHGK